ncbi:MAG: crossover junction endodeoxyribonuclease RuvC [Lentisphaeria bacterium]|nr:crossover junction endodeoxyribonuclease RuvC [Lentisphaeria bacterium]
MRIKNDSKLQALLAASEARGRGERAESVDKHPWEVRSVRRKATPAAVVSATGVAENVRILGMDTALRKTGWGIIDVVGKKWVAVDCGVIVNPPSASITDCMRHLNNAIKGLIERYSPDAATIEGGFYCKNARTAIVLGTSRGADLGVLAEAQVPVYEYAPRRVKQVVTGRGDATKEQVALMVSRLLRIEVSNLANDSTDALGLAICHAAALMNPAVELEKPL